ncbi:hypothetical protein CYMTET_37256 [Cymbomonas tetramitiformis]|uniref:Uncharacterized protein n=1 Tax=Cymbomonas tetramitiformis TaxID=36881 RepID=A0AAE0CFL8_9CHLO|nr:hypothetical protein CYMTET_37256 [Cymbomonas tetramitiformis]
MTNAQSKQRIPRITKENMDDGDFSKLAAEINAVLADMVVKQEADTGEVMSEGDVNKIKRSFFTTALNSIFFSDDDAMDKVRVYLLDRVYCAPCWRAGPEWLTTPGRMRADGIYGCGP